MCLADGGGLVQSEHAFCPLPRRESALTMSLNPVQIEPGDKDPSGVQTLTFHRGA